jgi:predicted GTPase
MYYSSEPIMSKKVDKKTQPGGEEIGGGFNDEISSKLEELSKKETDELVKQFKEHFDTCTKACKKPNILVAGITGAGKSALINAVFGEELALSEAGMPVTQHFQKYEPKEKPIVIYDSKGLEWKEHKSFIKDTGDFFNKLRESKDVSEHIHCIWYVVNSGRGRIEDFEAELVRKVFNPTPVIFVLNKSDLADSKTIKAVKKVIEDEKLPNNLGIHIAVSKRVNYTQSWCPDCLSDDVMFDEETKELECSDCGFSVKLTGAYGMTKLIQHTCDLLPELAKDAFMYSQTASLEEKDKRAKQIVLDIAAVVTLDMGGEFIKGVAEMCSKLFICWGWPLTAGTFKDSLAQMQAEYLNKLKFQERLAASAIDKLLGGRISKTFVSFIGYTMNRGMKKLNENLMISASKGELDNLKMEDFFSESDLDEETVKMFFTMCLTEGHEKSLDVMWALSHQELQDLKKQMVLSGEQDIFAGLDDDKKAEIEEFISKQEKTEKKEITITSVNTDKKDEKEEVKEEPKDVIHQDLDLD